MSKTPKVVWFVALSVLSAEPAQTGTYVYEPASDGDDGHLIDGSTWDWLPNEATVSDLLVNLGQEGTSTYDNALGFHLSDLVEGQTVADARLRLNQQGGEITNDLTVEISAALDLDPRATAGAARFGLPRTAARVYWTISTPWDSSGQQIAKYAETPDLSAIVNEVVAQTGWDDGPKDMLLFLELLFANGGDVVVRYDDTHGPYWDEGNPGIRPARLRVSENFRDAFWGKELLCRPKPTSMQVNVVPHVNADVIVEWGTNGITFPFSTGTFVPGGQAQEFTMDGLSPDSEYFYRILVRPSGTGPFETGPTRSFLTMPVPGQEGRICVTSDIHVTNQLALGLDTHMELLETTLDYMKDYLSPQKYHLWMDLGDVVVIRAMRIAFDEEEVEQRYRTGREYIDRVGHSLPFILVRGNHEEVNGWDYDSTPNNTMTWSGKSLLKYFPPPMPDEFYAGNDSTYPDLGIPGDYFAFDVGDLRIRCLDPFLFTNTRPHNGHGETGGSLDGWDWTIGTMQYNWLHDDFVSQPSLFNLSTIHHLTSCYAGPGHYYGRGGIEIVDYSIDSRPTFEWGGEDSTGANVISTKRPDFVYGAPHDMIVSLGGQAVIKGHDHFHARQTLNGMIYLTMAKPDDAGDHTGDLWGWRWVSHYPEQYTFVQSNSGFYSIVVDDTTAKYSYIQTYPTGGMGIIRDSFSFLSSPETGVDAAAPRAVKTTAIHTIWPNPARAASRVTIGYELGRAGRVRLALYDVSGRFVREVFSRDTVAGNHEAHWDGRDRHGRRVAPGVYFAKLEAGDRVDSVKMVLVQ
jgi:hypothetical protein